MFIFVFDVKNNRYVIVYRIGILNFVFFGIIMELYKVVCWCMRDFLFMFMLFFLFIFVLLRRFLVIMLVLFVAVLTRRFEWNDVLE